MTRLLDRWSSVKCEEGRRLKLHYHTFVNRTRQFAPMTELRTDEGVP